MNIAVCIVSVSPVRKEASHRSEMISQLIFGELAEILETIKDFTRVRCIYDDYEGWIQTNQLAETDEEFLERKPFYISAWSSEIKINDQIIHVPFSTPVWAEKEKVQFGKYDVDYSEAPYFKNPPSFTRENISGLAHTFLNTGYLWGGRSVYGVDCSGFAQQVFKLFDIRLPRDAYQQAEKGELVGFLAEAKSGDLAFFDNEEGRITHVGIMLNDHEIIHSSGRVRIDAIDHQGIINGDSGQRTHKLRLIKRYKTV
ncbi:MAG: dipeptidyl peptidase [Chitinophagaceae bacterium]|nr:dipeptidyl peptidase [Chitinophagaceae bacterium]